MENTAREHIKNRINSNMYENEFGALIEISESLSQNTDEGERLALLVATLENRMKVRRVTLLITAAGGESLAVEGHTGEDPNINKENKEYRRGEGIIGRVLETEEAILVPRIADEPAFQGRIHERRGSDTQRYAFLCVPVKAGGSTVGALAADIPLDDSSCPFSGNSRNLEDAKYFFIVVGNIIAHDVRLRRISNLHNKALIEENLRLHSLMGDIQLPNMIGNSTGMRDVYAKIAQVSHADTTALIRGESGTGKELVATSIHYASTRREKAFVKVNCAALSEGLLESELFGHEKGAFTGAMQYRKGRIEEAEGGTIFLDEIGDFSITTQVKLLRLLQEREYSVVGSNNVKKADVRFICATNRNLEEAVEEETFRQDLYYRINVFPINIPPLRERKSDILPLANHFIEKYAKSMNKTIRRISSTAIELLTNYYWPGNIRELENCIQHGILLSAGDTIQGADLPPSLAMPERKNSPSTESNMKKRVEQLEKDMITDALKATSGNVSAASRELGITARMVRYKIEKFKINVSHLSSNN